jgi:type II secretory pathway component GspD/PulD (secretin)
MSSRSPSFVVKLIAILALVLLTATSQLFAQPDGGRRGRGGSRGGFGGMGGGGLLAELQSETSRSELGLTEAQLRQIEELNEAARDNRDLFADIFQRLRDAQDEDEREQIRAEMRERSEQLQAEQDEQVKQIISAEQVRRLEQLGLQRQGVRALSRDEIAESLGLTEAQREELAELIQERDQARRQLGFRASEEEREAFNQEWDAKVLATLSDEQRKSWNDRLGPPRQANPLTPGSTGSPATVSGSARPTLPTFIEPVPEGGEVIASFTQSPSESDVPADAPDAATAPSSDSPASTGETKRLTFNFRYAPWSDVLKLFAQEANLSLDLQNVPPGTFNYLDRRSYTPLEALDVLNGYLLPKGYVLVKRDEFLVCLNIDETIPPNIIPNISLSELDSRGRNELLTVVFPLDGIDVEQAAVEINEIKGPQGKVVPLTTANSLFVTDIGGNLRRIRDLLSSVTITGPDDAVFKAYQLDHIAANDAENTLRELLGITKEIPNVSALTERSSRSRSSSSRSSSSRFGSRSREPEPDPSVDTSSPITMTSDLRTNKLLVSATMGQHQLIEGAIKTIDVDSESVRFSPGSNRPYFQMYTVNASSATEVTKTLTAIMPPGVVVNEDARAGKIHIMGTPDQHREVEMLIRQMDGQGGARQMIVYPLSKMDPMSAATTLRSMFFKDGDAAPTIEPDSYGRRLMIRADSDQIAQIRTFLGQLGEDGSGERGPRGEGPFRPFSLGGRDPQEILPLIEQMWRSNNGGSTIRVITPEQRDAVRDVRTPAARRFDSSPPAADGRPTSFPRPERDEADSAPGSPTTLVPEKTPVRNVSQTQLAQADAQPQAAPDDSAEDPSATEEPADADDQTLELLRRLIEAQRQAAQQAQEGESEPARGGVNIRVMGDDLLLFSDDPEELDKLEELLESALRMIPPRTRWTVFTLQSADAAQAAMMLEQLLPHSTVSMSSPDDGGFFGGLGSGLMDMTGLGSLAGPSDTLRIIPELRLNALFVSGPSAQVREVEEMLKILDASDWPDNYRNKVSRMIPIEYAEATQVYETVKEVYSAYLEENNNRGGGRGGRGGDMNPFAMLMGGGGGRGGRNDQNEAPPARLSVGVDTNTNHLIVWADETLFREIESLVQSIDKAAEDANRTIRVVNLQNTSSAVMQSAVTSLMPRVNVSTSGSRTQSSSSESRSSSPSDDSSRSRSSGGSSGGPTPEQIQQFRERMMQRMQGGGSTGSDSTRSGSSGGRSSGGFGSFGSRGGSDRGRRSGGRGR